MPNTMENHPCCPSCHNVSSTLTIPKTAGDILQATAAVGKVNIQTSAARGCPFCELVSQIWNHDMNRDWREHHTDRHQVCKTSLRWMDDGPVHVEFFYPFAEGMRGKDGEVKNSRGYVVSNPSGEFDSSFSHRNGVTL